MSRLAEQKPSSPSGLSNYNIVYVADEHHDVNTTFARNAARAISEASANHYEQSLIGLEAIPIRLREAAMQLGSASQVVRMEALAAFQKGISADGQPFDLPYSSALVDMYITPFVHDATAVKGSCVTAPIAIAPLDVPSRSHSDRNNIMGTRLADLIMGTTYQHIFAVVGHQHLDNDDAMFHLVAEAANHPAQAILHVPSDKVLYIPERTLHLRLEQAFEEVDVYSLVDRL